MSLAAGMRRWGLVVLLAGMTLLIQEYAIRLALPDYDPTAHLRFNGSTETLPSLGQADSRYRLIKNSGDYNVEIRFNRHGLRDPQDIASAQPGDLIIVGDSFVFGWGVAPRDRVSERVAIATGRHVFNLGIPADVAGYAKLLAYAESLGARARDIVLVFNMTDDLIDYTVRPSAPPPANIAIDGSALMAIKSFLISNSSIYFLSTSLITRVSWLRDIVSRAGLIVPLAAVQKRDVSDTAIASTVDKLSTIAASYRMTVLVVPFRGVWIGNYRVEERATHIRFTAALRRAGIKFVDMMMDQERGGDPMRYHFANDGHWRPIGHQFAADLLVKELAHVD